MGIEKAIFKPKVFKILYANGILSKRAVALLRANDGNKSVALKKLREENQIAAKEVSYHYWDKTRKRKKTEKCYKLHFIALHWEKYQKYIGEVPMEYAEKTLKSVNTTDEQKIKRKLRQSEVYAIMCENGVEFIEKPQLNTKWEEEQRQSWYYYESTEIKTALREQMEQQGFAVHDRQAILVSRAMGSIYAAGELFVVFDADKSDYIKLDSNAERIFYNTSMEYLKPENERRKRILYARDNNCMPGFLLKSIKTFSGKRKAETFFLDDNFYEETLFIPKTKDGIKITYIVTCENAKEELDKYLNLKKPEGYLSVSCDGMEEDTYILNFLYPDINCLNKFRNAVEIKKENQSEKRFRIHAYEGCEKEIRKIIPEAEIVLHSIKKVHDHMLSQDVL